MATFSLVACTSIKKSTQSAEKTAFPPILYFTYEGELLDLSEEEKPNPIQGTEQWYRDFYTNMKYPADARENGIQGIVKLRVYVSDEGRVKDVSIAQSLSIDCDKEALRAFKQSITKGYTSLIINQEPIIFRMEIPVGFWLR